MDNLDTLVIVVPAVMVAAGLLLGGAIAHWRRGAGFIITGAIIGGALMLIPAALVTIGTINLPYILAAAVVVILACFVLSFFG